MFDDASRTRRTDAAPDIGLADYAIVTALVAVVTISTYRWFDEGEGAGRTADASALEVPVGSGHAVPADLPES